MVKNPPAMQETWVQSLGREDPLEEEMATHSRILAWRIPWTEEPGGLYSSWGCKESDTTERLITCTPPIDNRDQDLQLHVFAILQVTLPLEVPKAHHH